MLNFWHHVSDKCYSWLNLKVSHEENARTFKIMTILTNALLNCITSSWDICVYIHFVYLNELYF